MLIYANLLAGLLMAFSTALSGVPAEPERPAVLAATHVSASMPDVPFYSQFRDISSAKWQKLGCGVADLAMIINFYKPGAVVPDTLLWEGLRAGAFIDGRGWSHQGLVNLARPYGFEGKSYDFSNLNKSDAFSALEKILEEGPVIASVYYTFDPKSPIPHLAVINGVRGDFVYYNDPASSGANRKISVAGFLSGWKKRIIVIRPQSLAD